MSPIPLFWEEQNNGITKMIGDYDLVSNLDSICISSSDMRRVGKKIVLPPGTRETQNSLEIEIEGTVRLLIPLSYQRKRVASLLIGKRFDNFENYLPLIQSLAELSIAHHVEKSKIYLDSTDTFVSNLLSHDSYDLRAFEVEAKALGYNFKVKRVAIAIHLAEFSHHHLFSPGHSGFEREEIIKRWKRKIERAINGFFTSSKDVITSYVGEDIFAVFKTIEKDEAIKFAKHIKLSHKAIFSPLRDYSISDITVGYSNPYGELAGIIKSFKEARLALALGQKKEGPNKSYYVDDFGLLSLIASIDAETQKHFAGKTLGNLKDDNLLRTLEVLLEKNFNIGETAVSLNLHRNTIVYRLRQIENILNYNPREFDSAVNLKIALLISKSL